MGFLDLDLILMLSFLLFGGLCIYTAIRLRTATKLFDSMVLYPGGLKKEDCCDPEGFMAYMGPRMGILGGVFALIGIVYAVKTKVELPKAISIVHIACTVAVLAWGFWIYHTAAKRFW